jgi:hypothetical protein
MYKQRVVVSHPNHDPYVQVIENNFSDMQEIVGGPLNFLYVDKGFFVIHLKNKESEVNNLGFSGTFILTKGLENIDNTGITGLTKEEAVQYAASMKVYKMTNGTIHQMIQQDELQLQAT